MADFSPAIKYVLQNEDFTLSGKVTPEPNGGKARFGVNSVFNPKAVVDGFYEMPKDVALSYAMRLYESNYWDNRGFAAIVDQKLATKLFDMAVNMGNGGEIEVLQKALSLDVTHKLDMPTQIALAKVGQDFMNVLIYNLKQHYQEIHDRNPEKYAGVINGWLARAAKIPE